MDDGVNDMDAQSGGDRVREDDDDIEDEDEDNES